MSNKVLALSWSFKTSIILYCNRARRLTWRNWSCHPWKEIHIAFRRIKKSTTCELMFKIMIQKQVEFCLQESAHPYTSLISFSIFGFPLVFVKTSTISGRRQKARCVKERESLWRVIEGHATQFYISTVSQERYLATREQKLKPACMMMPTGICMYFVRSACWLCCGGKRWVRDLSNTKTFVSSKNANVCDEHWGRERARAEHFSAEQLSSVWCNCPPQGVSAPRTRHTRRRGSRKPFIINVNSALHFNFLSLALTLALQPLDLRKGTRWCLHFNFPALKARFDQQEKRRTWRAAWKRERTDVGILIKGEERICMDLNNETLFVCKS